MSCSFTRRRPSSASSRISASSSCVDLAVRVEDLHQPGDGLAHRLAVAGVEMRAEREVAVDDLGEVVLAQLAERLGEVVDDEPVVVGEELVPHLRDLPAREVEVQPIDEGHVVADDVGHRREEVAGLHHHVDRLVGVAEHRDAGVARRPPPGRAGTAGLAVGLHRRDDLLRHLLEVGDLVEADDVPDLHHPLLPAAHVAEEVGDRRRAGQQRRVRRDLLDDVALAGAARPELDEVVVALGERDEPDEEEQLEPRGPSRAGS